ncbi:GlcG/HbpS family heme-binding protein [Pseudomonas antarctica]|uniref:GlcG/HbpS family heme-binding protein n=1 Tax=Pseudomonas antarctica TaxID=219572 RepID=UPI003F74D2A1
MNGEQSFYVPAANVSRAASDALLAAAIEAAQQHGVHVSVAIVDAGGEIKGFSRTDHAPFLTADAAIDKAWTAASFGYPTHVWNEYFGDPKLAPLAKTPRLLAVGGGHPLVVDGKLTGGIGISGGTYVQDQHIAEAALKAVGFDCP